MLSWRSWEDKTRTDWTTATGEAVVRLSPRGEGIRKELELVYPITFGPWRELAEPGAAIPRPEQAVAWVLQNEKVSSVLVAFASVEELEETLEVGKGHT